MKVGSLFSGIGGLDLGLERAGMQVVWQVEKDPYAQKVLKKHWPHVNLYSDVCAVGGGNLEHVDLICGGFPCQDISIAGKGKGITGARSGLWKEFARIVSEIHPAWVLIENVPALRSRGLAVVLSDLAASGYDAEWDCIPAATLGAPHRRDRFYLVAHARHNEPPRQQDAEPRGDVPPILKRDGADGPVANPMRPGLERQRQVTRVFESKEPRLSRSSWWATEPDVGRVANGVPARVDRLRCLGNAVVPQVAEYVGRLILNADP